MRLTEIETPALLVDRTRLARNIERMRGRLAELGVPLRPHVKTAKSVDVVRLAVEGQPGGITVSTRREAEHFLDRGFTDILYAVGVVPSKLPHVAALQRRGADITIILDGAAMAEATAREAEVLGTVFPVPIGSQIRIAPNHACMAAAHERHHVVDGGSEVLAVRERCNGW